jgi:hypothetical protein
MKKEIAYMIKVVESRKEGMDSRPYRVYCCDLLYWSEKQDCRL